VGQGRPGHGPGCRQSDEHIWARADEHFIKTYGIVHPAEQWESRRGLIKSPLYARTEALGAEFYTARTWERPQWYNSNRWWSPIIDAEHLNMRENAGIVDLSPFQIFELSGPGACEYAEYLAVNKVCKGVGTSAYTPWLTPDGGFHSDLTMMQTGEDTVRIVTGAFDGGRDEFWAKKHLPLDGSVTFKNLTMTTSTIGMWGPNAPAIVGSLTDADLSHEGSPYGSVINAEVAGISCSLFRVSYVGDTGWEIYCAWDKAEALYDALMEAGKDHGLRPMGIGVYGTTGRIEKGYRLMGSELESEYNPLEAGLARPKVKAADFIGKEAYLAARPIVRAASGSCRAATSRSSPPTVSASRIPMVESLGSRQRATVRASASTCCLASSRPSTPNRVPSSTSCT